MNTLEHICKYLILLLLQTLHSPVMADKADSLLWDGIHTTASALSYDSGENVMQRIRVLLHQADSMHNMPAQACLYMLLGTCYEETNKPDEALEAYRQGTAVCEQDTWLRRATEAGHEELLNACISMYLQTSLIYDKRGDRQLAREAANSVIPWISMSRDPKTRATSTLAIGKLLTADGGKPKVKALLTQAYYDAKALRRKDMIVTAATYLLEIGIREKLLEDNTLRDSILHIEKDTPKEALQDSVLPSPNNPPHSDKTVTQTKTIIQNHWEEATILVCSIILTFIYILWQRRMRRKQTARSYIEGKEEERKRLARELHDGVGNQLLAIQMQLNNEGPSEEVMQLLNESREQVRRVSHELMPPEFTHSTLPEIIADYAESISKSSASEITCHMTPQDADWTSLPGEQAFEIYRIIQEAVTNAIKHAGATSIAIGMQKDGNRHTVIISDDGTSPDKTDKDGIGVRTMQQRADYIGASLELFHGDYGHTVKLTL